MQVGPTSPERGTTALWPSSDRQEPATIGAPIQDLQAPRRLRMIRSPAPLNSRLYLDWTRYPAMIHACPHCQSPLDPKTLVRVIPEGQRKTFPLFTFSACPSCRGLVQMNLHPLEIQTLVLVAVVLFVAGSISLYVSPYPAFPWPFLVAFLPAGGLALGLKRYVKRNLARWPRYRARVTEA